MKGNLVELCLVYMLAQRLAIKLKRKYGECCICSVSENACSDLRNPLLLLPQLELLVDGTPLPPPRPPPCALFTVTAGGGGWGARPSPSRLSLARSRSLSFWSMNKYLKRIYVFIIFVCPCGAQKN